jgi:hypothetical protein
MFGKLQKDTIKLRRICLSIRPHGTTPTGRIFTKFDIGVVLERSAEKILV